MKLFALYAPFHLSKFNMDYFDILLLYDLRGTSYVFENNLHYKLSTANRIKKKKNKTREWKTFVLIFKISADESKIDFYTFSEHRHWTMATNM